MRKYLLLIVIIGFMSSCGVTKLQTPPNKELVIELTENKDRLYIKANEWMVTAFADAKSVIQFSDKEEGIIKGKYLMRKGQPASEYIPKIDDYFAIITIRVRGGASKIEIAPVGMFYTQKVYGIELGFTPEMFNSSADSLIEEFYTYMKEDNSVW